MKDCSRCKQRKPIGDFDYDKKRRRWFSLCIPCHRATRRVNYLRRAIVNLESKVAHYRREIDFLNANPGVFLSRNERDEAEAKEAMRQFEDARQGGAA